MLQKKKSQPLARRFKLFPGFKPISRDVSPVSLEEAEQTVRAIMDGIARTTSFSARELEFMREILETDPILVEHAARSRRKSV